METEHRYRLQLNKFMAQTTPSERWINESSLTKRRDTYPFIDPFRFKNTLRGKVVVVTYAHRGIGRASALAFAAAGASVVCIARPTDSLDSAIKEIGEFHKAPTFPITADLLDASVPQRLVSLIEQEMGPIDILINITPPSYMRPFDREPDITSDWWTSLEHNLKAPIAMTHAVLPSMIARKLGIIISAISVTAVVNVPFVSSLGVAKAGLLKFHHQLDLENRPKGILNFAVHPGLISSHLHDPSSPVLVNPQDFVAEPRMRTEFTERAANLEWAAAGLASGTFVALCVDQRCAVLSGMYINAERDLGEVVAIVEREKESGAAGRVEKERLYVLKVDEL
ncbi:short-chain dehydrogenase reductase sdr [Phlyctema vagabunda]|uniref:Short-chain dehydrogenase reductase sdr n=1 Tax=Phlyctema vagabunda TaxID=108571 RepID=A0ABR4PUU4_9HELO